MPEECATRGDHGAVHWRYLNSEARMFRGGTRKSLRRNRTPREWRGARLKRGRSRMHVPCDP